MLVSTRPQQSLQLNRPRIAWSTRNKDFSRNSYQRFKSSEDIEPAPSDLDWREFRARLIKSEQQKIFTEDSSEKQRTGNAASTSYDSSSGTSLSSSTLWAHPLVLPEKGALLLAHPMMFLKSQQYFYTSIIVLLDHDETGSI